MDNKESNSVPTAYLVDLVSNRKIPVTNPRCRVGRDDLNDIVISGDQSISRFHFIISYENNQYLVQDAKSRHGTFLNGNQIGEPEPINDGDVLKIGVSLFWFVIEAVSQESTEEPTSPVAVDDQEKTVSKGEAEAQLSSTQEIDITKAEEVAKLVAQDAAKEAEAKAESTSLGTLLEPVKSTANDSDDLLSKELIKDAIDKGDISKSEDKEEEEAKAKEEAEAKAKEEEEAKAKEEAEAKAKEEEEAKAKEEAEAKAKEEEEAKAKEEAEAKAKEEEAKAKEEAEAKAKEEEEAKAKEEAEAKAKEEEEAKAKEEAEAKAKEEEEAKAKEEAEAKAKEEEEAKAKEEAEAKAKEEEEAKAKEEAEAKAKEEEEAKAKEEAEAKAKEEEEAKAKEEAEAKAKEEEEAKAKEEEEAKAEEEEKAESQSSESETLDKLAEVVDDTSKEEESQEIIDAAPDADSSKSPALKDENGKEDSTTVEPMDTIKIPDWCKRYFSDELKSLNEELDELNEKIRNTQERIKEIEGQTALTKGLRNTLLTQEGDTLIEACKKVLTLIGWKVTQSEEDKQELLLESEEDDKVAIARIIWTDSTAERSHLGQLSISLTRYWCEKGVEPKGVLLVAKVTGDEPSDPADSTDEELVEYAGKKNVCFLSTLQMLAIYREVSLKSNDSDDVRTEILESQGWLDGYKIEPGDEILEEEDEEQPQGKALNALLSA